MSQNSDQPVLAVDQPILNSPFREPERYWLYERGTGLPITAPGRREAGYYFRDPRRTPDSQLAMFADEHFNELVLVNQIRGQVRAWRERGYPEATPVTRKLLAHWTREGRDRQLFFCQREAAETIIWLTETTAGRRLAAQVPVDSPTDPESQSKGYGAARRLGAKMATGSGKTVVMAMIIAWSVLNKASTPNSRRYSDAILVVCPNLTVKERLGGAPREVDGIEQDPARPLVPGAKGNYYDQFDLVPAGMRDQLGQARMFITNWHVFMPEDDSRRRGVVQRGEESDAAFCARVLRDLGSRGNVLVINDEAHHAYRPAGIADEDEALEGLSAEEKQALRQDKEEATVWVSGLDRINAVRGINFCFDLSATPFYISGSGYVEGTPFPWLVSDFGLVDAIECGIVKIPRVPVADDTGRPEPRYFRLWQEIMKSLSPKERGTARRKPKPEAVLREAEGALQQLAGLWNVTFESFERGQYPVPPCMIIVCDNTNIAKVVHEYIAEQGRVFADKLKNETGREVTIRIDSKLLAEADLAIGGGGKAAAAEALRRTVATVGKPGEPGAEVRCVVSVGMLTEGWDAQNVTQILGLRAFQSQLLCEQVVGRGLRRISYDFDLDENGIPTNEEYVDVYGIPFEVIPIKKRAQGPPPVPKESTLVQALKEREAQHQIEFPRVEGYVFDVSEKIRADLAEVPPIFIEPNVEPTQVISRAQVGYQTGTPTLSGPGEGVVQTRQEFYEAVRFQQIEFDIARRVTDSLLQQDEFMFRARHLIFPQVLQITRTFLRTRVDYGSVDRREVGLLRYVELAVERLAAVIRPVDKDGAARLLPRIERFRPRGSTSEVIFRTSRPCRTTVKSHISHVVLDTETWEASVAFHLEASPLVATYARNDHLDLAIPYEYAGSSHDFLPDFVVRLTNGVHVLLEVKGYETEQDRAKYAGAQRWCEAVNNWGEMGHWVFEDCKRPSDVPALLQLLASSAINAAD